MVPDWAREKFWKHANPKEGDECWLWSASCHGGSGYAIVVKPAKERAKRGANYIRASHVSLEISGKPRPDAPGNQALHGDCSNPQCVNPNHLRWGTLRENMADKIRLGRHNMPRGEGHYRTKFSLSDIEAILLDSRRQDDIAADFGVCRATISHIKNRRNFKQEIALIEKKWAGAETPA